MLVLLNYKNIELLKNSLVRVYIIVGRLNMLLDLDFLLFTKIAITKALYSITLKSGTLKEHVNVNSHTDLIKNLQHEHCC